MRTMIEESNEKQNAYLAVHIPQVQRQCGSNGCGVFAIAFALHAAPGHCVGDITFDQSKMRIHLLECFKARIPTPFPTVDKKAAKRAKSYFEEKIEVFCTCMMPDTYGDTVQCGACQRWYHLKCAGLLMLPSKTSGGVAGLLMFPSKTSSGVAPHMHFTLYINYTLLLYSVFIIALTSLSIELIGYHYCVPAEHILYIITHTYIILVVNPLNPSLILGVSSTDGYSAAEKESVKTTKEWPKCKELRWGSAFPWL